MNDPLNYSLVVIRSRGSKKAIPYRYPCATRPLTQLYRFIVILLQIFSFFKDIFPQQTFTKNDTN